MMQTRVYIVDADGGIRRGLQRTLQATGHMTRSFASGSAFLRACARLPAACVILDLTSPGLGGFAVMRELAAAGHRWPVIVLAGHADRGKAAHALRTGSVLFLEKPVREAELVAAVLNAQAILRGGGQRRDPALARAVTLLTRREQEVLDALLASERIKQTAARLGIAESTVKSCRKTIKRKLGANSTAQLIQLVMRAGFGLTPRP